MFSGWSAFNGGWIVRERKCATLVWLDSMLYRSQGVLERLPRQRIARARSSGFGQTQPSLLSCNHWQTYSSKFPALHSCHVRFGLPLIFRGGVHKTGWFYKRVVSGGCFLAPQNSRGDKQKGSAEKRFPDLFWFVLKTDRNKSEENGTNRNKSEEIGVFPKTRSANRNI